MCPLVRLVLWSPLADLYFHSSPLFVSWWVILLELSGHFIWPTTVHKLVRFHTLSFCGWGKSLFFQIEWSLIYIYFSLWISCKLASLDISSCVKASRCLKVGASDCIWLLMKFKESFAIQTSTMAECNMDRPLVHTVMVIHQRVQLRREIYHW